MKYFLLFISAALLLTLVLYLRKPSQDSFEAPKTDYLPIQFMVSKDAALMGVVNNLAYYGFVKDESALEYALIHSEDNYSGREGAITLENGNTINTQATYTLSQNMDVWQIANILLNEGKEVSCQNGCPDGLFYPELLPGGELAPTIAEKYSWVETYADCVESIGHDGGQLSSEQYYEKTGIRSCISPDGREFTPSP